MIPPIGQRFGRLVVTGQAPSRRDSYQLRPYWACVCDCGNVANVEVRSLKRGGTRSCGCLRIDAGKAIAQKRKAR